MSSIDMSNPQVLGLFEETISLAELDAHPEWQNYRQLVSNRYKAKGFLELGRSTRTTDPKNVAKTNRMRAEFIAAKNSQSALPEAMNAVQEHLDRAIATNGSETAAIAAGDVVWVESQTGERLHEQTPNATLWPADPGGATWWVDHIVELQHGGADDASNYCPVPYRLHSVKSGAMNRFGQFVREQMLTLDHNES